MLRVRDVMTTQVFALASDQPLRHAVWCFSAKEISGAPVRDPRGNLVGVLSKSDLVDPIRQGTSDEDTVRDAMTPAVWAVHPDAPLMEAITLMVKKSIHRVLVVRGPGRLEGIVTAMSVMRALADGHVLGPAPEEDAAESSAVDQASVDRLERIDSI